MHRELGSLKPRLIRVLVISGPSGRYACVEAGPRGSRRVVANDRLGRSFAHAIPLVFVVGGTPSGHAPMLRAWGQPAPGLGGVPGGSARRARRSAVRSRRGSVRRHTSSTTLVRRHRDARLRSLEALVVEVGLVDECRRDAGEPRPRSRVVAGFRSCSRPRGDPARLHACRMASDPPKRRRGDVEPRVPKARASRAIS